MIKLVRHLGILYVLLLVSGCASYGVVVNEPLSAEASQRDESHYSITSHLKRNSKNNNDLIVNLAFSGGGTRAAAFSYGVLQALRDTMVVVDGNKERLLDQVDGISSVSGGSFTSAYYGLFGDKIFENFETEFLRQDIQGGLVKGLLNPKRVFGNNERTEMAIQQYDAKVFKGATFADLVQDDRPLIVINASDLAHGVRFSFIQEYFDMLCSDLSTYPVSRAVAASSAVPVLFNPVVVENHADCVTGKPAWFTAARERSADNVEATMVLDGMDAYFDKENEKFAHFVDGGITDNLGLRAITEIIELAGGVKLYAERFGQKIPRRMVLIVVNAALDPEYKMSSTNKVPPLAETIGAISDVQLHRYNAASIALMRQNMARWATELSTPEQQVIPYFILLGFHDIVEPERRLFFNQIPTSFVLVDEQVDELIEAGNNLLKANPEFRRLLNDLASDAERSSTF